MPMRTMPIPDVTVISVTSVNPIAASAATNLPFTTSSRWMGCEISLGSVCSARSWLIASKPKAMPSSGPRNPISATNDGIRSGDCVNSSRNGLVVSVAADAASRRKPAALTTAPTHASPIISSRIRNRTDIRSSANSLPATTRQPVGGSRWRRLSLIHESRLPGSRMGRARSRNRWSRPGTYSVVSVVAIATLLGEVAPVDRAEFLGAAVQVDDGQTGVGEPVGDLSTDVPLRADEPAVPVPLDLDDVGDALEFGRKIGVRRDPYLENQPAAVLGGQVVHGARGHHP